MSDMRIRSDWLSDPLLQSVLAVLNEGDEEARIVGGPVRNALLGAPVTDFDIATTCLPEETMRRAGLAGFNAYPTGIDHGTITVTVEGRPFEVTTLRKDIATDGRHAEVSFGRDWEADARRRDFTINALYATADGEIVDFVGGLGDIESRTLRFIGDAEARIREDYLRILRFFRFFAWYGHGRPDADGIRASARLKDGLQRLSAERIWNETRKLLGAPDPSRALLWMRQSGVLTAVLPETEKWGIDTIHPLAAAERDFGWPADPLLRLMAIVPPDGARLNGLAKRLKLSGEDRNRLLAFAAAEPPKPEESDHALSVRLYLGDRQAILDRIRPALANARLNADLERTARLSRQASLAEAYESPDFPIGGDDLIAKGIAPGPELGRTLQRLRTIWADGGFAMSREALLDRVSEETAS